MSPTEIFQKLGCRLKILYPLSYQWICGFISSFSQFWGLSVKVSPTERLRKRRNFFREYDNISLSLIFHRYHYLISKNVLSPAVSKCRKTSVNFMAFLLYPEIFIEKIGCVPEILQFEGFRGHPTWRSKVQNLKSDFRFVMNLRIGVKCFDSGLHFGKILENKNPKSDGSMRRYVTSFIFPSCQQLL